MLRFLMLLSVGFALSCCNLLLALALAPLVLLHCLLSSPQDDTQEAKEGGGVEANVVFPALHYA